MFVQLIIIVEVTTVAWNFLFIMELLVAFCESELFVNYIEHSVNYTVHFFKMCGTYP